MNKTINSVEIARLAGVSRSTVSKVINNYPDIPEATKTKVRSVIEEYGYTPNASAQVLKGKAQNVIALYVFASEEDTEADPMCRVGSPYVMGVISNFILEANRYGHRLMIELLRYNEDDEVLIRQIQGHFQSKSIAAAAFLGLSEAKTFIDQLVAENYPIAVIDRPIDAGKQAVNISTDDLQGAWLATRHLIDQGFKKVLFIGGDKEKRSAQMRAEGYRKAMGEHGLTPDLMAGGYSEEVGKSAARQMIAMDKRPEAVVCASDAIAYGLIHYLHDADPEYLDKLALVGFDNSYFNDYQRPSLSSIRIDFQAMARQTVQALLDAENYQDKPVPVELVVRESSRCG